MGNVLKEIFDFSRSKERDERKVVVKGDPVRCIKHRIILRIELRIDGSDLDGHVVRVQAYSHYKIKNKKFVI